MLIATIVIYLIIYILALCILITDYLLVLTPKRLANYINRNCCFSSKRIKNLYKENQPVKYLFKTEGDSLVNQNENLNLIKEERILIECDNYYFYCSYNSVIDVYETDNYYAFIFNFKRFPITFIIPKKYIKAEILPELQQIISKIKNITNKKDTAQFYYTDSQQTKLGIFLRPAVIITDVLLDSTAQKLGLEKGDIILEINDENIISDSFSSYKCANKINKSKHIIIKVKNINTNEIKTIETDL